MQKIKITESLEISYSIHGDKNAKSCAVILHGIMGSKKNWHGFLENLSLQMPNFKFLAFDLRNHGESSKHIFPLDLNTVSKDIVLALNNINIEPQVIIGHSYGSKIAILAAKELRSVNQVFLLDSSPGPITVRPLIPDEPKNALEIMDILININWPLSSRKELLFLLDQNGISGKISRWMTTNLEHRNEGYYLIFEPKELKEMLLEFIKYDAWEDVKIISQNKSIYLVSAEYGFRISEQDKKNLKIYAGKNGYFHIIKNSGHIIHLDNPKELCLLLKENMIK